MTTDPRTWTTEQHRDWLAREDGWGFPGDPGFLSDGRSVTLTQFWLRTQGGAGAHKRHDHPIPDTLDAAAAAMPDGWTWVKCFGAWTATNGSMNVLVDITGDEKHDRFLLAVLCRIAAKENAK